MRTHPEFLFLQFVNGTINWKAQGEDLNFASVF